MDIFRTRNKCLEFCSAFNKLFFSSFIKTAELAAAQEKQMEVCDVCGAFLIVGDAQQRIDDHLMGKQHVGYARLKSALQEIMVSFTNIYVYFLYFPFFLCSCLTKVSYFNATMQICQF